MKLARTVVALGLVAAVSACGGGSAASLETVPAREAAEVLQSQPDAVLLDIRTPEEFAASRVEGSINVDFYAADFRDRIAALDRDTTYVVYCRSGNRSASAMELFDELGFTSVYEVEDGILAWVGAGLPLAP